MKINNELLDKIEALSDDDQKELFDIKEKVKNEIYITNIEKDGMHDKKTYDYIIENYELINCLLNLEGFELNRISSNKYIYEFVSCKLADDGYLSNYCLKFSKDMLRFIAILFDLKNENIMMNENIDYNDIYYSKIIERFDIKGITISKAKIVEYIEYFKGIHCIYLNNNKYDATTIIKILPTFEDLFNLELMKEFNEKYSDLGKGEIEDEQ